MDNIVNYLSLRAKNLDDEDHEGLTVFARYVLNENYDMATRLLQRGANVNHTNRDGKSTLTLSVQQGKEKAVSYLLGKGADPHYEDLIGHDTCDYAKNSEKFANFPVFNMCMVHMRKRHEGLK